ncbi:MAG: PocR ligand-binding domain-containing protein [Clostridia bacterium]|nr:PocR ligand-binding domain-containing protein [Clostridia bacterium]
MFDSGNSKNNLHQSVQNLAEYLYNLTGMHVGIHDIERMYTVAAGDDCQNICSYCRTNCPSFMQKCICYDKEHLELAYRTGQKVVYRCHLGMTEAILPVTSGEQFLGVMFLGQVRIIPDETMAFENLYARLAKEYPEQINEGSRAALETAYRNTAVMTSDKLESLIGLAELAEKGTHVDRWLNHFKQTTDVIVRQYLEYLDLIHIPLADLSIASIAEKLNISYSQLNRISVTLYGQPLKQHILDVKINAAAVLLKEQPELSISGAAALVGIDNSHYFSKLFQKRMGCRCSEYRKLTDS